MRQYKGPHMPLLVDTGSADSFLQVRASGRGRAEAGVYGRGRHAPRSPRPPPLLLPLLPPLQVQLKPEALEEACEAAGYQATLRMQVGCGEGGACQSHAAAPGELLKRPPWTLQEGYDHSYYFISTFIDDHIAHHAAALRA
jgi:S-formylglutathione hydrolase FrmB